MLEADPVPAAAPDGARGSVGPATTDPGSGSSAERPFTALERTICLSDRPDAPIIVGLLARLDGRVDADSLRQVTLELLARHPMARARRHPGPGVVARWQFPVAPDVEPVIQIAVGGAGNERSDPARASPAHPASPQRAAGDDHAAATAFATLCDQASDLTLSPALRVGLLHLPGTDAIGLVAHHAALDGAALLLLLTEILAGCRTAALSSAGPARFVDRPDPNNRPGPRAPGPTGPSAAARSGRGRRPVGSTELRPRSANRYLEPVTATPGPGYGVVAGEVALPVPTRGATVNDLLVAAAHLAVDRWNRRCGRATGVLRLRMPMNLRTRAGGGAGSGVDSPGGDHVGNASGQATVVSTPVERVGPGPLLAAVIRQTAAAKVAGSDGNPDPAGSLWFVPARARDRVARTAIGLARPFMMPSVTVSNLGRIARLAGPDLTVTALDFFPFAGLPQGLAIGVTGYGGRLRLGFSYHRALFDEQSAAAFAAVYAAALSELRGG